MEKYCGIFCWEFGMYYAWFACESNLIILDFFELSSCRSERSQKCKCGKYLLHTHTHQNVNKCHSSNSRGSRIPSSAVVRMQRIEISLRGNWNIIDKRRAKNIQYNFSMVYNYVAYVWLKKLIFFSSIRVFVNFTLSDISENRVFRAQESKKKNLLWDEKCKWTVLLTLC